MNLGTRLIGRPRNRWQDEVREDGRTVGGEGWQEKVRNREERKKLLRSCHIPHMAMEWMIEWMNKRQYLISFSFFTWWKIYLCYYATHVSVRLTNNFCVLQEQTTVHPVWGGRWYVEKSEVTSPQHSSQENKTVGLWSSSHVSTMLQLIDPVWYTGNKSAYHTSIDNYDCSNFLTDAGSSYAVS